MSGREDKRSEELVRGAQAVCANLAKTIVSLQCSIYHILYDESFGHVQLTESFA